MSDLEFQREVLHRLAQIEADLKAVKVESAAWKNQLTERCETRREDMILQWSRYGELGKRVAGLEHQEHRRRGGAVAVGALLTAAGALGGLIVKYLENVR